MKLIPSISLTLLLSMTPHMPQAEPVGLVRVGEGDIHYLGIFKVYTAELFVEEGAREDTVLDEKTSRCLTIRYAVDLSAEDIIAGADGVLERQHTDEQLRPRRQAIDLLHAAYQNISAGDSYNLCYDADTQTNTLYLNDEAMVAIPSPELGTLYFGIWLGENKPIDTSLRSDLLRGLTEVR